MNKFAHLHVHTEFSLLDGIARIKKLVKTAYENNMPAIAITDHGNLYGAYRFYKEVMHYNEIIDNENRKIKDKANKRKHIKAIIGCEVYVDNNIDIKKGKPKLSHLVLLAKNNQGYKNLIKLVSISYTKGFYYKPRIDDKILKKYSEGIICLSACLAGDIPGLILKRQYGEAEKKALEMKNIFKDDFYLELQNHKMPEQINVNHKLLEISEKLNIKTVATNDVHYIYKEDHETQDVLMCIQMRKMIDDPNRMKFPTNEFYLKTYDEMKEIFQDNQQALDNTIEIVDKCEQVHLKHQDLIPNFEAPEGKSTSEYLREIVWNGIKSKYPNMNKEITSRVEKEISVIENMGFVDYFLIVWDFVMYAKNRDILVGPGRGSGAGSIVAYAMGITSVDPLKYDLLFERFLNPDRVSMPDFDIDFSEGRDDVIEYVSNKYGADKTSKIITFGTMASKAAVKDVARVLGVRASEANDLTKKIDVSKIKGDGKLKKVFGLSSKKEDSKYASKELKEIYDSDDRIRKVIDLAIKIEGVPRHIGQHAAGVVICKYKLDDYIPLAIANTPKGQKIVTQFDMVESEKLGLLKMDFLGLRTLTDIQKTVKMIEKKYNEKINFEKMEFDDPNVYSTIAKGDTDLIFQLESSGFKKFMQELKPEKIEDIIAGISLYRPGPMDYIPEYISNKLDPSRIKYVSPLLKPILEPTFGVTVYQEQVMQIFQELAGYSLGQADIVRRAMGKKKEAVMQEHKKYFVHGKDDSDGTSAIEGSIAKAGITKEQALDIFKRMESFASYAFNKSHAAVYSYIAYQTAYLKTYYPVEFYAATLNNIIEKPEDVAKYTISAREKGIEVLEPNINISDVYFQPENKDLRFGLAAIKNVGISVVSEIVEERTKNGKFKDLTDFIERISSKTLNKRCIEAFIFSGTFDVFGKKRSQLFSVYDSILERVSSDRKNSIQGQVSMFETVLKDEKNLTQVVYPNINEYSESEKLKKEKEVLGVYISGHPLDDHISKLNDLEFSSTDIDDIDEKIDVDEEDGSEHESKTRIGSTNFKDGDKVEFAGVVTGYKKIYTRKDNKEMAFVSIEDLKGEMEMIFFPEDWKKMKQKVEIGFIGKFEGSLSIRDDEETKIIFKGLLEDWAIQNQTKYDEYNSQGHTSSSSANDVKQLYKSIELNYDTTNKSLNRNIGKIIRNHQGDDYITINCSGTNKKYSSRKVAVSNSLKLEICSLIDSSKVKIKD